MNGSIFQTLRVFSYSEVVEVTLFILRIKPNARIAVFQSFIQ